MEKGGRRTTAAAGLTRSVMLNGVVLSSSSASSPRGRTNNYCSAITPLGGEENPTPEAAVFSDTGSISVSGSLLPLLLFWILNTPRDSSLCSFKRAGGASSVALKIKIKFVGAREIYLFQLQRFFLYPLFGGGKQKSLQLLK